MIPSFFSPNLNLIKILIPILFVFLSSLQIDAMKVDRLHPQLVKRNISTGDGLDDWRISNSKSPEMEGNPMKRLRRLPHVFSKVLELPFASDAEVSIDESSSGFRFVAEVEDDFVGGGQDVRAHAVEIHPGVTKIVVRGTDEGLELTLDNLEVDTWRFRLPASTKPELATAVFSDGELIVTVPKDGDGDFEDAGRDQVWGASNSSRLLLVQ